MLEAYATAHGQDLPVVSWNFIEVSLVFPSTCMPLMIHFDLSAQQSLISLPRMAFPVQ